MLVILIELHLAEVFAVIVVMEIVTIIGILMVLKIIGITVRITVRTFHKYVHLRIVTVF